MKDIEQKTKIKAIILAAGVGSRIKPLTDNCPKCLLKVGRETILNRMVTNIQKNGIHEVVFVLGYLEEKIKNYVKTQFPDLIIHFVRNARYAETNTGFSLMLAMDLIQDSATQNLLNFSRPRKCRSLAITSSTRRSRAPGSWCS